MVRQSPVLQRQPPKKFGQGLRVDFAKGPARGPIACAAAAAATATDEKPAGLLPAPPRPFGTGRQDREDEEDEDEDEDADADKEMADLTPPPGMFSICSGGAQMQNLVHQCCSFMQSHSDTLLATAPAPAPLMPLFTLEMRPRMQGPMWRQGV